MNLQRRVFAAAAVAMAAATSAPAFGTAGVPAVAGTFANIRIDGSYSDWDSVPVASTNSVNTGTPIDFASLKIANDSTNVYFLLTFNTATNPQSGAGVFMAVDSDNDATTGYNIFGSPLIGSNFGFQNDFPFAQTASKFNSSVGGGYGGVGTTANATYAASPYAVSTTQQEIAVPLLATETDAADDGGYSGLIFPTTFTVEFYSTDGAGDTLGPVEYTLADDPAAAPEPTSLALFALAGTPLALRRRQRGRTA